MRHGPNETDAFARLIGVLDYLVDDRVGIVKSVTEIPREIGDPAFFHYAAVASDTSAFCRQQNFRNTGGAASTRIGAVAKAVGEAVERYCGAIFDVESLALATAAEAPFACVAPDAFALYSDETLKSPGFPWVKFDSSTPVRWADAMDPLTGESWHVPGAMVYVPYHFYRGTGDTPITQPISTGLACHCSYEEAALGAIYEVIERDAFTIMWQGGLSMPQLRIETLSDANYDLVRRFEETDASVTLLDITMGTKVPSVLAVLQSESSRAPSLVVAAAVSLDPEVAVRKSLEEAAHTRRYSQQIKSFGPELVVDSEHRNIISQIDHLNFWADHGNRPLSDFMLASDVRITFDEMPSGQTGDPRSEFQLVCELIRDIGHQVLVADLTTEDVRSLGLHVVRSLIPGFNPLFMGHALRSSGGKRLATVPAELGYPQIDVSLGGNPLPHPYP